MKINLNTINHREVTGSRSGYPTPVLGVALFADSVNALKALGEQYNLGEDNVYGGAEIHEFRWKSGWSNCNDNGQVADVENYAATCRAELETRDYPSEWDLESVTEISYSDDADHYRLGLFVPFGDGWQYADRCSSVERIPVYECPNCGCEWDDADSAESCCQ